MRALPPLVTAALLVVLPLAAAAQSVSAPGPAAVSPPPEPAGEDGVLKKRDKLICRSVRYTGSRFPERVCKTRSQMREQVENARKSGDKLGSKQQRIARPPLGSGPTR